MQQVVDGRGRVEGGDWRVRVGELYKMDLAKSYKLMPSAVLSTYLQVKSVQVVSSGVLPPRAEPWGQK